MKTIKTIEELKDALAKPESLFLKQEQKFLDFAKDLMCNFQIEKGDKRYWMTEIEFYVYTDEHRDIITYPRNCPAGMWFFHASGVDISFASKVVTKEHPITHKQKPYLDKTAVFGGILIRGIVLDIEGADPIDGPIKVCDELFDQFDAFGKPTHFPQIVPANEERKVKLEKGLLRKGFNSDDEKKVLSILKYNYSGYDEKALTEEKLIERYKHFREEGLYRFKA